MSKITIITRAYNPGNLLIPCVESVLTQSFSEFTFLIADNGSTDGSKDIYEKYSAKDSRILYLSCNDNRFKTELLIKEYVNTPYYFILDHDDILLPNALQNMYDFAENNNLDVVIGQVKSMNEKGETVGNTRSATSPLIIVKKDIPKEFRRLQWHMRTMWGKLIKTEMVRYYDRTLLEPIKDAHYGGDTIWTMQLLFNSNRIGLLSDCVYGYLVHEGSESFSYNPRHLDAIKYIRSGQYDHLVVFGEISDENSNFIEAVYLTELKDITEKMLSATNDVAQICDRLIHILKDDVTCASFTAFHSLSEHERSSTLPVFGGPLICNIATQFSDYQPAKTLFTLWLNRIYSDALSSEEIEFLFSNCSVNENSLCYMLCCCDTKSAYDKIWSEEGLYNLKLFLTLHEEPVTKLLAERLLSLKERVVDFDRKTANAGLILSSQNLLLKNEAPDDLKLLPIIIFEVVSGQLSQALSDCISLLDEQRWQKSTGVVTIAINLAAACENADIFLALKKMQCEYQINEGLGAKAERTLADIIDMIGEDDDVLYLKERIFV